MAGREKLIDFRIFASSRRRTMYPSDSGPVSVTVDAVFL